MNLRGELSQLYRFAQSHKDLYIYGIGDYAEKCIWLLNFKGIHVTGFIQSRLTKKSFYSLHVYDADMLLPTLSDQSGIILAMHPASQSDLQDQLKYSSISFFSMTPKIHSEIKKIQFSLEMSTLGGKYPATSYTFPNNWKKILVVRIDRLGDLIWTTAFFRELRRFMPKAYITAVVSKEFIQIMELCPYVNQILGFDTSKISDKYEDRNELYRYIEEYANCNLTQPDYDVVFLPRGIMANDMIHNILLAVYSGAPIRIGNWFELRKKVDPMLRETLRDVFSILVDHEKPSHEVNKILDMLRAIGAEIIDDRTELWMSNKIEKTIPCWPELMTARKNRKWMAAIGISANVVQRSWNPKNYRELFTLLKQQDICFVLCGGEEAVQAAQISYIEENCIDLTGKTNIFQIMRVIECCDVYVGSDTGLAHIAAAFRKPAVELFLQFPWEDDGNMYSSPVRCGAWRTKTIFLQPTKAADDKCFENGYCISNDSHCINMISVVRVKEAVEKMLHWICA